MTVNKNYLVSGLGETTGAGMKQQKVLEENGFNLDIKNPHLPEEERRYSSSEQLTLLHESFQKSHELLTRLKKELVHG